MDIRGKTLSDDLNFYSLLGVLQSGMWLQADIEKYLGRHGLSHGRFSILLAIDESNERFLIGNELALRLGVSKATIAKLTGKLIGEGFVACGADGADLRRKRYALTGKAKALLQRIIPGYLERLREMSAGLTDGEKSALVDILSKINFLDPLKTIIRMREKTLSEKSDEIRGLCRRGSPEDVDRVMGYLDGNADLPTTKIIDYYLGTVDSPEGMRRIEHFLFQGTQIQRNYCTLYFARRDEWPLVRKAYEMGLIDYRQAFSK